MDGPLADISNPGLERLQDSVDLKALECALQPDALAGILG